MVFDAYAQYYNLLYTDKNYNEEVEYVLSLIEKYRTAPVKTLLDIGCGTGNHDFLFSEKGLEVTGIDSSPEMIRIAKSKEAENLKFLVANATNFLLPEKFDVVVSLFHVINYHTTNEQLYSAFEAASRHVISGGLFIFDTWYGPSVLSEKPENRIKKFENDDISVKRVTTSTLNHEENTVTVNYDITVHDKKTLMDSSFSEKHIVRYLFKPEIDKLFKDHCFDLIHYGEWLTGSIPSLKTWGVCFIGKRK